VVDYHRRYPPLVNAEAQTLIAARAAAAVVGPDRVDVNERPNTGGEDFSFMLAERPGAFILIGNGMNADGSVHDLHTPLYDFNDDILCLGASYWCCLALTELGDCW